MTSVRLTTAGNILKQSHSRRTSRLGAASSMHVENGQRRQREKFSGAFLQSEINHCFVDQWAGRRNHVLLSSQVKKQPMTSARHHLFSSWNFLSCSTRMQRLDLTHLWALFTLSLLVLGWILGNWIQVTLTESLQPITHRPFQPSSC